MFVDLDGFQFNALNTSHFFLPWVSTGFRCCSCRVSHVHTGFLRISGYFLPPESMLVYGLASLICPNMCVCVRNALAMDKCSIHAVLQLHLCYSGFTSALTRIKLLSLCVSHKAVPKNDLFGCYKSSCSYCTR